MKFISVVEAIQNRRSIRGLKSDLVSKENLRKILNIAIRVPSAVNTQPWEITVITGNFLDKIRLDNLRRLSEVKESTLHLDCTPPTGHISKKTRLISGIIAKNRYRKE